MAFDEFHDQLPDTDPAETSEWLDSLRTLAEDKGNQRASYVIRRMLAEEGDVGVAVDKILGRGARKYQWSSRARSASRS